MNNFKNKLAELYQHHELSINKINREYQMHFYRANLSSITSYPVTSLDDNTINYNRIINRNSIIQDDTIENLLRTMSCVYNIFDSENWIKYTDDMKYAKIKDYSCMYVNSIMDDKLNKDDFHIFINLLKKYKLDVEQVNYDKDEEYENNLNWIIVYCKL